MPDKKIRFDDFELDYARFQLHGSGKPVHLEGLPLQLLMFLVEKRGQLVTREDISAELWSKDVFVDVEQGINTAIRKIRRAVRFGPLQEAMKLGEYRTEVVRFIQQQMYNERMWIERLRNLSRQPRPKSKRDAR